MNFSLMIITKDVYLSKFSLIMFIYLDMLNYVPYVGIYSEIVKYRKIFMKIFLFHMLSSISSMILSQSDVIRCIRKFP